MQSTQVLPDLDDDILSDRTQSLIIRQKSFNPLWILNPDVKAAIFYGKNSQKMNKLFQAVSKYMKQTKVDVANISIGVPLKNLVKITPFGRTLSGKELSMETIEYINFLKMKERSGWQHLPTHYL